MKNKADISNTLIVIPIYNTAKHLDTLLKRIKLIFPKCNILCINDGSIDKSLDIIIHHRVNFIDRKDNRGKGFTIKQGFDYAIKQGYSYLITIDSDLQHEPAIIPYLLKSQNLTDANLVIGFREFSLGNMPVERLLSNCLTSCIVSYISNKKILDSQSGYRLYDLRFYNENEIKTDHYQMETEILLNYITKDAVISHVEIPVIYNDEKSNISHLRDIMNFIKVIWREII